MLIIIQSYALICSCAHVVVLLYVAQTLAAPAALTALSLPRAARRHETVQSQRRAKTETETERAGPMHIPYARATAESAMVQTHAHMHTQDLLAQIHRSAPQAERSWHGPGMVPQGGTRTTRNRKSDAGHRTTHGNHAMMEYPRDSSPHPSFP